MKFLLVGLLATATAVGAETVGEITTSVHDLHRDANGVVDKRYETTGRGGVLLVETIYTRAKTGQFIATARTYHAGGKAVMSETDEDSDGFFETLVIYHPSGGNSEAFTREKDGTVKPFAGDALKQFREVGTALKEFWNKALPPREKASKGSTEQ